MSNPRDLFLSELGEILWIERTLEHEVLPKLIGEVHDEELRKALREHLEQTHQHVERVQHAFLAAGAEPAAARSDTLAAAKSQHERDAEEIKHDTLRDLFHAGGAARTEHLELAIYDSLIGLADELGLSESKKSLAANRSEEEEALKLVERLAKKLRGELPQ